MKLGRYCHLINERDQLRAKLDLAVEALELVTKYDPSNYSDKDYAVFITVNYNYSKEALAKVRGEK